LNQEKCSVAGCEGILTCWRRRRRPSGDEAVFTTLSIVRSESEFRGGDRGVMAEKEGPPLTFRIRPY
jgi:hypothetical protein